MVRLGPGMFRSCFGHIRLPVSWTKIGGPSTCHSSELRLPDTQLVRLKEILSVWKTKKLWSHYWYISKTFLRKLFVLLHSTRAPHIFLQGHWQTWHGGGAMAPHSFPLPQLGIVFIQMHWVPWCIPILLFHVSA